MRRGSGRYARPRQADIARLAGVSQPTVSLVLADAAGAQVAPATRERVLAAARRLGYAADPAARKLAGGRNLLIGLYTFEPAFPIDQRDFYYPFLVGVEEEAAASGHDVLLFTSAGQDHTRSLFRAGVNRLLMADGCILLGRDAPPEQLTRLLETEFPFVFIGRRDIADLSYVGADYRAATAALVHHLYELGHRSLAYLGQLAPDTSAIDREAGFASASAGLGIKARTLRDSHFGAAALQSLQTMGVTAVAVESQQVGALRGAIEELRLDVPRDLSYVVLGDPIGPGGSADDSSTRFTIPRREMGAAAVRSLLEMVANWRESRLAPHRILLPCQVTLGASTGAVPIPS